MATETRLNLEGLTKLAKRRPSQWLNREGKPCVSSLARDASMNRSHLHKVISGRVPGLKVTENLLDLAEATGLERNTARDMLFERVHVNRGDQA